MRAIFAITGLVKRAVNMGDPQQAQVYRGHQRCSRIDYSSSGNVFFVTVCVSPRRVVFNTSKNCEQCRKVIQDLQNEGFWGVYLYCIMPDHIHLVVSPGQTGLREAMRRIKGRMSIWWRKNGDGFSLWQDGYFDHCLRRQDSFEEKCAYILRNPVRVGKEGRRLFMEWKLCEKMIEG